MTKILPVVVITVIILRGIILISLSSDYKHGPWLSSAREIDPIIVFS